MSIGNIFASRESIGPRSLLDYYHHSANAAFRRSACNEYCFYSQPARNLTWFKGKHTLSWNALMILCPTCTSRDCYAQWCSRPTFLPAA